MRRGGLAALAAAFVVTWAWGSTSAPAAAEEPAAPAASDSNDTVSPELLRLERQKQRIESLSDLFSRQTRIWRLSYRLLYAAVDMCPDRARAAAGFAYANAYMFRGAVRAAASELGFNHRVSVVSVSPGSPAAQAGIRRRDEIKAIGDWAAPYGEGAVSLTAAKLRNTLETYGHASLTLTHDGVPYQVDLKPDFLCDIQVLAAPGDGVAAYADGSTVVVFHGLMDAIDDDDVLAAAIAREIANDLIPNLDIEHEDKSAGWSNFFEWGMEPKPTGDLEADRALAVDFGLAADYVGAHLLARAGFPPDAMAALWQGVAARPAKGGGYPPPDARRLAAVREAVAEVDAKLAAGRPLKPDADGPKRALAAAEAEVPAIAEAAHAPTQTPEPTAPAEPSGGMPADVAALTPDQATAHGGGVPAPATDVPHSELPWLDAAEAPAGGPEPTQTAALAEPARVVPDFDLPWSEAEPTPPAGPEPATGTPTPADEAAPSAPADVAAASAGADRPWLRAEPDLAPATSAAPSASGTEDVAGLPWLADGMLQERDAAAAIHRDVAIAPLSDTGAAATADMSAPTPALPAARAMSAAPPEAAPTPVAPVSADAAPAPGPAPVETGFSFSRWFRG